MNHPRAAHPQAGTLAAHAWAELREPLDRQLSPLGRRAIEALSPRLAETILDIGCGTGQTSVQLAEQVGPAGHVIGVDVAPVLLGVARARAAGLGQVRFVECDAALLDLPPQSCHAVYSRFGVMAFADPVAAFANLHRLTRPSGRLSFVCWRALADNELDALPLQAAGLEALLDSTPFSLAEPDAIRAILRAAGYQRIAIDAHDAAVSCDDLETTATVLMRVGPLGRILRENPGLRPRAEPRLRAALAARGSPAHVALMAGTWIVTASA